jgi:hypothetical protein
MVNVDKENSRELVIFYSETGKNLRPDEFDLLVEYLCQSEAILLYYNVFEKLAQFFIEHRRSLQPIIQYLDTQRGLGIRHKTIRPSQKRLDAIVQLINDEKIKDEEDAKSLNIIETNDNKVKNE